MSQQNSLYSNVSRDPRTGAILVAPGAYGQWKNKYKKTVSEEKMAQVQKFLFDNFHILEALYEQLQKSSKNTVKE